MIGASLLAALGLALIHIVSGYLRFLDRVPRSRWLSFAGGVAVALVFLDLLPELARSQQVVTGAVSGDLSGLKNHIYIVALLGLIAFYGLQRTITSSRRSQVQAGLGDATTEGVFWLSMSVFSIKNAIVGYLLIREDRPLVRLVLFFVAIGLEFFVSDRGLHREHKASYDRTGRWVVAAAVLLGWAVGYLTEVPEVGIAVLSAFLGGFIVLNVLREELPEEQESRFWAFVLGAGAYAALRLTV